MFKLQLSLLLLSLAVIRAQTMLPVDVAIVVQSVSPLFQLNASFVDIGGTSVENTFVTAFGGWKSRMQELGGWPTMANIGNATGILPRFSVFNIGTNTTLASLRTQDLAYGLPRGVYGNFSAIFLLVSTLPAVYAQQNVIAGLAMSPPQPDGPCVIFYILRSTLSIFQDPATGRPRWRMLIGALVSNTQNMAALSGVLVAQHKSFIAKGLTGIGSTIRAISATETVASLKDKIQSQFGIASDQQQLLILDDDGREMNDLGASLTTQYNFNQTTIDLLQRPASANGQVSFYLMRKQTFAMLSVTTSGSAPDMISSWQDAGLQLLLDGRWPAVGNSYETMLALVDQLIVLQPHVVIVNALTTEVQNVSPWFIQACNARGYRPYALVFPTSLGLLADAKGHFSDLFYEVFHTQQWSILLKYIVHNRPGIREPFVSNDITGASAAAEMGDYFLQRYPTYPPLSLPGLSIAFTAALLFQHGYSRGCTVYPCPASQIRDGIPLINWLTSIGLLNIGSDTNMMTPLNPFVSHFIQQGGFQTPVTPSNLAQCIPRYPMPTVSEMAPMLDVSSDGMLVFLGVIIRFIGFFAFGIVLDWTREAHLDSHRNNQTQLRSGATAEHQQRVLALQTWPIGIVASALLFGMTNWSATVMDLCSIQFKNLLPEQKLVGYNFRDQMISLFGGVVLVSFVALGLIYSLLNAPSSLDANSAKHSGSSSKNVESHSSVRTISFAGSAEDSKVVSDTKRSASTCWRSIFILWLPQVAMFWWQAAFIMNSLHADATINVQSGSITGAVILSSVLAGTTHGLWWMWGTSRWTIILFATLLKMGVSTVVSFLGQSSLTYTRNITNRLSIDAHSEWSRANLLFLAGGLFSFVLIVSFGIVLYWTKATKSLMSRFLRSEQGKVLSERRNLLISQSYARRLEVELETKADTFNLMFTSGALPSSTIKLTKGTTSSGVIEPPTKPDLRTIFKSNLATANLLIILAKLHSEENIQFLFAVHWYKRLFERSSPFAINTDAVHVTTSRKAVIEKPLHLDTFKCAYDAIRDLVKSQQISNTAVEALHSAFATDNEIQAHLNDKLVNVEHELAVALAVLENKPIPTAPPATIIPPSPSTAHVAVSESHHARMSTAQLEMSALGMARQPSTRETPGKPSLAAKPPLHKPKGLSNMDKKHSPKPIPLDAVVQIPIPRLAFARAPDTIAAATASAPLAPAAPAAIFAASASATNLAIALPKTAEGAAAIMETQNSKPSHRSTIYAAPPMVYTLMETNSP